MERRTPEQTTAFPEQTTPLRRPFIQSSVGRTLAVTTLGIASLMQHEAAPEKSVPRQHHVSTGVQEPAWTDYESLRGASLVDQRVQLTYKDFAGRMSTIEFTVNRDVAEHDLRLNVNGKKFRCDESYPMFGKVSELIDDVTAHETGDGIRLFSDEYGEALITKKEMIGILESLVYSESPVTTVQVRAKFVPKKNSKIEGLHQTANFIGGLFGAEKKQESYYTVQFTRENGTSGQIAAK